MIEPSPTPDPLVGKVLRAYEIQEPIGVSRWGKVYRGLQHTMNRIVAVRILSPTLAAVPGVTERFLEETRADASLTHPHLVTVYEAGQSGGTYFCAMEYMDGPPLSEFLRKAGGVHEHHLLQTIAGVAQALDFLWQHKVSHQPPVEKNVLTTTDGTVKLINVEPVEMQASQSPQEDLVNLAVMVATLTNEIGPVSKSISEFVEGLLGTGGHQHFTSLSDAANAAEALDRELFPPAPAAPPTAKPIKPGGVGLLAVAAAAVVGLALVAFAGWCWWRAHRH
jgi:serine/threonine protein kinase